MDLGAAGGLEAIAVMKAIETGWLHPTLNQDVHSSLQLYIFSDITTFLLII